jgi:RND family efflux transporter MFP subunit
VKKLFLKLSPKVRLILTVSSGLIIIAAIGLTIYFVRQNTAKTKQTTATQLQTTQVKSGNLIISASGDGTLVPGKEANLNFPTEGSVASIYVQVGQEVEEGAKLAELEDPVTLKVALDEAKNNLAVAQEELDTLLNASDATMGNALLDLAKAEEALADAKSGLKTKDMQRCDDETLNAYYINYLDLKKQLDNMDSSSKNYRFYLDEVLPLKADVQSAYSTYSYCAGYSDYEIQSSEAELLLAQSELKTAQEKVNLLKQNNGIDPDELAKAQNNVANAEISLEKAQKNLDNAVLKAPFAGTITSISGEEGDYVEMEDVFIKMADLKNPKIEFQVDETDMDKVVIGNEAEVVFDAFPDNTFTGSVVLVEPALASVGNYLAVKGMVKIEIPAEMADVPLYDGMKASVEIISGKAMNTLLVPIEAIHDLGDGQYAVFKLNDKGEPRLQVVEVGLMDSTSAEIKSGLQAGDMVSTGIVETY